jgi:CRP/FNR family transcriptional regulator
VPAVEFLQSLAYFGSLSGEELAWIAQGTQELSVSRGEVLFLEGEPCQGLYAVRSGRVRVFKTSPSGREQVLFVAAPGDTFNDAPVFDELPNPASASALEPSDVLLVRADAVRSLVADCPAALPIIRVLASHLRHLTTIVEDLSFRSVVGRLARLLLELASPREGESPVPRLTQDDMAAMVGSVRDVVSRGLRALEKEGAIDIRGHRILVTNAKRLREMLSF